MPLKVDRLARRAAYESEVLRWTCTHIGHAMTNPDPISVADRMTTIRALAEYGGLLLTKPIPAHRAALKALGS